MCPPIAKSAQPVAARSLGPVEQPEASNQEVIDAFLAASRALVAVAARSLAGLDEEVTLPQFRALMVLFTRGQQRSADLAEALAVTPSTASRMIERLVRKGLVRRARAREDRRAVRLHLTDAGRQVIGDVTERRKDEIRRILRQLPSAEWGQVIESLHHFALAAGETPDPGWALGWEA